MIKSMLNSSEALKLLGSTIRILRKESGLTQETLAEMSERHPVYISELERGKKNPSMDSLLRICTALETTPGGLLDLAFLSDSEDGEVIKKQFIRLIDNQPLEKLKVLFEMSRVFLQAN